MKKGLQILAHWCQTLAPGLALLAVLSIMVLGSTTLVSEAGGRSNQIEASVGDIADIDTAAALVRCSVAFKSSGTAGQDCPHPDGCPAGIYSVKANGPAGSLGEILCRLGDNVLFSTSCVVASPCSGIPVENVVADPEFVVHCRITPLGGSNRPARAQCQVTAAPSP